MDGDLSWNISGVCGGGGKEGLEALRRGLLAVLGLAGLASPGSSCKRGSNRCCSGGDAGPSPSAPLALPGPDSPALCLSASADLLQNRNEWWVPGKIVEVRHRLKPYWQVGEGVSECVCACKLGKPGLPAALVRGRI